MVSIKVDSHDPFLDQSFLALFHFIKVLILVITGVLISSDCSRIPFLLKRHNHLFEGFNNRSVTSKL